MPKTNRIFVKKAPSRSPKKIFIFCEGEIREPQYFKYFIDIDPRIALKVHPRNSQGDNHSPTGLFEIAKKSLLRTKENPNPIYDYDSLTGDEVWFVIDVDSWEYKIGELLKLCANKEKWFVAISNPCFEVWLYYHYLDNNPKLSKVKECKSWKTYVNRNIPGGFDSRKDPIHIQTAIKNANTNYYETDGQPDLGCTNVYKLAEVILPFVKKEVDILLEKSEKN